MTNYKLLTAPAGLESTQRDLMRKNTTNILVAMVGAISALAFSATARADMGRTEGSWGVSPSGAATYSIPLWVQPGPKGMQPSLAFVYNSSRAFGPGSSGTMGVGWALAGFSSIDRCAWTNAEDGKEQAVVVDQTDRFCLDGKKLRITSGPVTSYGAVGAVYQTQIANFARVTSVSSAGSGPLSFLVHTKDGRILEYGNTEDSRVVLSGSTVYRWMLNKVSDRDGNSYVVTYTTDNTVGRVPLTVSWGPPVGSGYQYQAAFNYTNKSNPNDWVSGRQGSSTIVIKQRLNSVTIGYSTNGSSYAPQRQYLLDYNGLSPITGRTRLTSITECAATTSICLKPTTIAYQNGTQGVSNTPTSVPSVGGASASKYDFNGDGRSDLAYFSGTWKVAFSTGAGFATPIDTGVSGTNLQVGRFVSAPVDGFLYGVGGVWRYTGYNGSSFTTISTGVAVLGSNLSAASDVNGDGLVDILYSSTSRAGFNYNATVHVRLNTTTGTATVPSFSSSTSAALTVPVGPRNGAINFFPYVDCPSDRRCDMNGDGAPDLKVLVTTTFGCGPSGCTPVNTGYDLMSGSGVYTLVNPRPDVTAPNFGIRFNSDRCADTVRVNTTSLQVSSCGTGVATIVTLPAPYLTFLDWDGDGRSDEIVNNGGTIGVYKSTGDIGSPFSPLITTSIPYNSGCKYFPADIEGDGLDELVCVTSSSTMYYSHNGNGSVGSPGGIGVFITQVPDLLSNITDGYGLSVSPSYVSVPQSNYTKGVGTALPLVDDTSILYVVGRMRISDGFSVSYDQDYTYKGARRHALMDEVGASASALLLGPDGQSAGFEEITFVDSRNGIKQTTTFEQLFPRVGMVRTSQTSQADSNSIFNTSNVNLVEPLDSTGNNARYFPYVSESETNSYEVGGSLNGGLVRNARTTFGYSSFTYGNLTTVTTVVTDKNSANEPTWTTAITNGYEPALTSGTDWCVGFVNQVQVAKTSTAAGASPVTRTVGFASDVAYPAKCRLKKKTIEPQSAQYKVTETYDFDPFGNVNSLQVVGTMPLQAGGFGDMPTRTTTIDWGAAGQFPVSVTDPSGSRSTFAYNAENGTLKDAFDPNSTGSNIIKASFEYDGFARQTRATRPDGTYTVFSYDDCATVGCVYPTHKLSLKETEFDSANGVIADRYTYLDVFDRPFVTRARLLNGATWDESYQWSETQYDSFGRVYKQYMPCTTVSATASCRQQAATNSYDALNRLTESSRPRSQSGTATVSTTYAYAGVTQTTTTTADSRSQTSVRVVNVDGTVRQIRDANEYAINFTYDAAGSLTGITDSEGASRLHDVTVAYGVRAFQVAATDSAIGAMTNTFNALGELVRWTDAKGQNFSATYDLLSRPLNRFEPDAVTSWTWGSDPAQFNRGQLQRVESAQNGKVYAEDYTYDDRGRPLTISITIPDQGSFNYDYAYDGQKGWLDTVTYPVSSTDGYRFALKFAYQNGVLRSVADANAPATTFWTADSSNAWGQLTQETFGNSMVRSWTYDAANAHLSSIKSGSGGNTTSVQNLSYVYDGFGNVILRANESLGLTENFYYTESGEDNLFRLEHSNLKIGSAPAIDNLKLTYDKSGNILTKNEAGLSEPMVNQEITWTSYNYPSLIESGVETASFDYGPERQRWKMEYNSGSGPTPTETTYYIGGLFEKVVTPLATTFRHSIPTAGGVVAIYTRSSAGAAELNYMLGDHLGSTESFVNGASGFITKSSFSAFGTRRNAETWSGPATNPDDLNRVTRQGYTYQTVLASMGFNHMNGRVQDAVTGRFLSADPFNTDPGYTQNYNRYSYVYNNPLTATDPSGFGPECPPPTTPGGPSECPDITVHPAPTWPPPGRDLYDQAGRDYASQYNNQYDDGGTYRDFASEYGKGAWESMAASYWQRPFYAEMPELFGPANLEQMFGPFQSPFDPPKTSLGQLGRDLGPTGPILFGLLSGKVMAAGRGAARLTGQMHHGISRTVHKALEAHPNLKGLYSARDSRFVTQAKDLASHKGYDTFHRNLDAEVAGWIRANPSATQAQFETYLRGVYQRADVLERFPNGL
jgi:RHS repeat-associated protein